MTPSQALQECTLTVSMCGIVTRCKLLSATTQVRVLWWQFKPVPRKDETIRLKFLEFLYNEKLYMTCKNILKK